MSVTVSIAPIIAAVATIGENVTWNTANEDQRKFFLPLYNKYRDQVLDLPEIISMAFNNNEEVNRVIQKHGFDRLLPEITDTNRFAILGILKLIVKWLYEGKESEITYLDKKYPAVHFCGSSDAVTIYRSKQQVNEIIRIATKNGDFVYITIPDKAPQTWQCVWKQCNRVMEYREITNQFDGVKFPMIELDQKSDISWMHQLYSNGFPGMNIVSAFQQTKLKMNEIGAIVESAVAMEVCFTASVHAHVKSPLIINQPFLIWFERKGIDFPLVAGFIDDEDWKNPGKLDF